VLPHCSTPTPPPFPHVFDLEPGLCHCKCKAGEMTVRPAVERRGGGVPQRCQHTTCICLPFQLEVMSLDKNWKALARLAEN
jgi:hypothetical protein